MKTFVLLAGLAAALLRLSPALGSGSMSATFAALSDRIGQAGEIAINIDIEVATERKWLRHLDHHTALDNISP